MRNLTSRMALFAVSLFSFHAAAVQPTEVERLDEPASFTHAMNWTSDLKLEFERLDMAKISLEDRKNIALGQPVRVAIAREEFTAGQFKSQGEWSTLDDLSIWRLQVRAEDAAWLSFTFDQLFLPPGASLFIYNEQRTDVLGPFTDKDNKRSGVLSTSMVDGGAAYIEISVPTELKPYLKFNLNRVKQGYRNLKSLNTPKAGACNIDVVCPQGNAWRDEIRSVARYIFDSGGGTFTCTGNLVNNVTGDRTPYFMTANHCVSTPSEVNSMVLFWNFEKSVCGGPSDGSQAQSQSGAQLRATVGALGGIEPQQDMTLVELDSTPPESFNVHWSGWDAGPQLPTSGVSIHHPDGTEKRISIDSGPIVLTNFGSTVPRPNGSHLMIAAWDEGTTEGGSSGSGFWNQDRRIVGVLSGGGASCETPDAPDFYAHLASHYDVGVLDSTRMKVWLDPNDTGALSVDGVDACDTPQVSFTINPNPAEAGQDITFTSTVTGTGGPFTYAWDFNGDGVTDSSLASPVVAYPNSYVGNVDLTVTAAQSCQGSSSAAIVVEPSGGNTPPVAQADAAAAAGDEGTTLGLTAAASTDVDGQTLSFSWTQTAGATAVLSDASASAPTVTLPQVTADAVLTFEVTVTDTFGASDSDSVSVTVRNVNRPPNAIVSNPTLSGTEGGTLTLNAGASSDPDGDVLTFSWAQTSGVSVNPSMPNGASTTITLPQVTAATTLVYTVTVTDPAGLTDTANVTVTVNDTVTPPATGGGGGGGGALGWTVLFLLAFALMRSTALRRITLPVAAAAMLSACSTPEGGQTEPKTSGPDAVEAQVTSGDRVRVIRLGPTTRTAADLTSAADVAETVKTLDARERRYEKIKPIYEHHLEVTVDGETETWQISPKGYIQKPGSYELYKIDMSALKEHMQ